MAIYHLHCDIIGRSGGRSATAAAAYRATEKIEDRTTGEKWDYTKKEKALFTEILTNGNVPKWAENRTELWNSCEEKENRKNSQFCRSFDVALMKELDLKTNIELVEKWVNENYIKRGLVADIAIHAPHKNTDGTTNKNLHAHILVPTRKMNLNGWSEKDREGNDREFLRQVRTSWADTVNAEFQKRGMTERIDERTLEEQGIDREPQQHIGVIATAMQRKGKETDRKRYKSQEEEQKPETISVKVDEVENALQTDEEYKRLQELLKKAKQDKPEIDELKKWQDRILAMSPKEWQSFSKNMEVPGLQESAYGEFVQTIFEATRQAKVLWVQNNIEPITKEFEKNYKAKKTDYENYLKTKPHKISERPNALKAFFYSYITSDGQKFSGTDYDQYRMAQQCLLNKWENGKTAPQGAYENAEKELKNCYDKKYSEVKNSIESHYPKILKSMLEGIKNLTQTLEQFRPIRAMVTVVNRYKERKNAELKNWNQEQKRIQNRNINRSDDFGISM